MRNFATAKGLLAAMTIDEVALSYQPSTVDTLDGKIEDLKRTKLAGAGCKAVMVGKRAGKPVSSRVFEEAYNVSKSNYRRCYATGLAILAYSANDVSAANDPGHVAYMINCDAFRTAVATERDAFITALEEVTDGKRIMTHGEAVAWARKVLAAQPVKGKGKRKANTDGHVTVTSNYSGSRTVTVATDGKALSDYSDAEIAAELARRATGNAPTAKAMRSASLEIAKGNASRGVAIVRNLTAMINA